MTFYIGDKLRLKAVSGTFRIVSVDWDARTVTLLETKLGRKAQPKTVPFAAVYEKVTTSCGSTQSG